MNILKFLTHHKKLWGAVRLQKCYEKIVKNNLLRNTRFYFGDCRFADRFHFSNPRQYKSFNGVVRFNGTGSTYRKRGDGKTNDKL